MIINAPTMSMNAIDIRIQRRLRASRSLIGAYVRNRGAGCSAPAGAWAESRGSLSESQKRRGTRRHQQHAVGRGDAEILQAETGEDFDRDRPRGVGVEHDRGDEIAERGDEGDARAG